MQRGIYIRLPPATFISHFAQYVVHVRERALMQQPKESNSPYGNDNVRERDVEILSPFLIT